MSAEARAMTGLWREAQSLCRIADETRKSGAVFYAPDERFAREVVDLATRVTEYETVLRLIAESRNLGVDPQDLETVRAFIEEQGLRYKTVRREDGQQVVVSRTAEALDALARLSRADASQVAEWAREAVEK